MTIHYTDDAVTLHHGDCLDVIAELPDNSIDAIITDPPYGLEFMGKDWDRPWAVSPTQAVGFAGRENNLTLPSYGDNRNANCTACGGRQRGAKRCTCATPQWDRDPASDMREFQAWCTAWATECLRVLKPGGHVLAFGGSRTWHRLASAIEDSGFEIRDSIAWLYGSGFPKSMDVSKAIDKAAGAQREVTGTRNVGRGSLGNRSRVQQGYRTTEVNPDGDVTITAPATDAAKQWQGWGTALKPAFEPIVVGRKPLTGTVAQNVTTHGTGALNIDGCRVEGAPRTTHADGNRIGNRAAASSYAIGDEGHTYAGAAGRWPANVVLDGEMADLLDQQTGHLQGGVTVRRNLQGQEQNAHGIYGSRIREASEDVTYGDSGGASRFFPTFRYEAKAHTTERPTAAGVAHPTVKPLDLMRWLVRLVTPPNGVVLDPFAGSGTTAEAAVHEHMRAIVIEREADYLPLIVARLTKPMAVGFDFSA